jgi:hypothetical protein
VVSTEPDADAFVQRLADALDREAERAGAPAPGPVYDVPGRTSEGAAAAAVVAALRAPSTWTSPPPDLRARILAAAAAESVTERVVVPTPVAAATPEPTPEPIPAPGRVVRLVPRWRRLAVAVPVAAVAAVAFTFAVLAVDDLLNRPDPGVTFAVRGTPLAPQAGADVSVAAAAAGFSVVLDAHDLPAAAPGSYYAAFLSGPRGVVPLGSFHARKVGKPITMWSGVDPEDYPTFTVTLQREGAPPGPSDLVVLTGSLSG